MRWGRRPPDDRSHRLVRVGVETEQIAQTKKGRCIVADFTMTIRGALSRIFVTDDAAVSNATAEYQFYDRGSGVLGCWCPQQVGSLLPSGTTVLFNYIVKEADNVYVAAAKVAQLVRQYGFTSIYDETLGTTYDLTDIPT